MPTVIIQDNRPIVVQQVASDQSVTVSPGGRTVEVQVQGLQGPPGSSVGTLTTALPTEAQHVTYGDYVNVSVAETTSFTFGQWVVVGDGTNSIYGMVIEVSPTSVAFTMHTVIGFPSSVALGSTLTCAGPP